MSKETDRVFDALAEHVMFLGAGTMDLKGRSLDYRKGKTFDDFAKAVRRGLAQGRGKLEFELGMISVQLQATTADDGLTLVITFTGPELSQSFARAFDDYRLRELIAKVLCEETGPLAAEIRKHVTVAIESAGIVAQAREVVRNGLAKGLHEVERRLQEAGAKAAEGAYGRFLGGMFGRLRKAMELEAGMQETAAVVSETSDR